MAERTSDVVVDLDHLLQAVRDGLLLHPAHAGAVRIVIESEAGDPLHVVKVDTRRTHASRPALRPRPRSASFGEVIAVSSSAQQRYGPERGSLLLERCGEQQRRITELEQRLQEMQQELYQRGGSSPPAHPVPLSPASLTDNDSSSSISSNSPHRSDDDDDGHETSTSTVAMTDDADDAPSSSLPRPQASDNSISTAARKSGRSKNTIDRWTPSRAILSTTASSTHKERKAKRRRRGHLDVSDGEQSTCSDKQSMEVDSASVSEDEDDAVEVAALVVKLREGYDMRQSVALDSLSRESMASLRQQVLGDADGLVSSTTLGQITSVIATSTSLKTVGYYLRATLAHRLKTNSHRCYKRLARDTLGLKSPTDVAAYPALYELVQQHYPNVGSVPVEAWLENPIFTADMTWSEWKRCLTKKGRPIIDAALQQFKASVAPFQDWMQLGWVEVYDDNKHGQGVRALRDICMPASKAKEAQRDVAASISVVAADLHCAGSECVLDKDAAREADPMYLVQLDKQRVFDARHYWIGKINHLPDRLCNLKLTNAGKLVQTREIAAGLALTFDYGVDYWVYQLSGLELSEWCAGSSVVCSRGRQDLFRRMHQNVQDYTDLLHRDWVKRPPAVWSELEREAWMANLIENLEALGL